LILRGQILQQLKQNVEALHCFDEALQLTGDDPEVERLRGNLLHELGRVAEAVAAFNRVLKPREANSNDFQQRGLERDRLGDKPGALADYTQAIELDPRSALTRANRGWAYLNSTSLALADFDQAIKLAPDQGDLYNGRGYARVLLGKYRQGVEDAAEALRHDPAGAPLNERVVLRSNAACIYAQAAGKASADLESADHEKLAKEYTAKAIELLAAAAAMVPENGRNAYLHNTTTDPAFDPIRYQPAFRALLGESEPKPAATTGS
jgi:tetratricopeptide (TPR) repeat protein